jgi:hypothetical protein
MPLKKKGIGLAIGWLSLAGAFAVYGAVFYTPPLLASGERGFIAKAYDFLAFGWHVTRGSFIQEYLKDYGRANEDFFMGGWYRERYLRIVFRITPEEQHVFLAACRGLDRKTIRRRLYAFAMGHPAERAEAFRKARRDFLAEGRRDLADKAFSCALIADPEDMIGAFVPAAAALWAGDSAAYLRFLRLYLQFRYAPQERN